MLLLCAAKPLSFGTPSTAAGKGTVAGYHLVKSVDIFRHGSASSVQPVMEIIRTAVTAIVVEVGVVVVIIHRGSRSSSRGCSWRRVFIWRSRSSSKGCSSRRSTSSG